MSIPSRTITWLHLSDLHARQRSDWDAARVTSSLVSDLKRMQKTEGLRPDFIFFTGDAAFGSVKNDTMQSQYQKVREFFDQVRKAFEPEIPLRSLYLVPGNHDVDRNSVLPGEQEWLRHEKREIAAILAPMQDNTRQWQAWMDRLGFYRHFVASYGLGHLAPDDPHLIWADSVQLHGVHVGIVGLNSAWSCHQDDKGKLWMGAKYQTSLLKQRLNPEVAFTFALTHHPGNWLTDREDPHVWRFLRQQFPILLHGHEHQEWVEHDSQGHLIISAGAAYQSSWMANGYNFGQFDLDQHSGCIHLRQWDDSGGGWVERNIAGHTTHGRWNLKNLNWLQTSTAAEPSPLPGQDDPTSISQTTLSPTDHYSRRFCEQVLREHDRLELFGCTIPQELRQQRISVAYVSLNLSREIDEDDPFADEAPAKKLAKPESAEDDEPDEGAENVSASFEQVLNRISGASGRLMIRGPAGAGKSTLLRWCAIQAAEGILAHLAKDISAGADSAKVAVRSLDARMQTPVDDWRTKTPVLIRLRDCKEGTLPPAAELPQFLAKHLPSPPQNWMLAQFDTGKVLVLLDGVDEVHEDHRPKLAEEIGKLIKTYPKCTYVVSTRPGAVEQGWLAQLCFEEARVEPMGRQDRGEFIDKWFEAASLELMRTPRAGEDLQQTARKLKAELDERPDVGLLARWPLLCAMICAIFRERTEQLPDTPAELCAALCEMLLHRRERETPGLQQRTHFLQAWSGLTYPQKQTLLATLAWQMLMSQTQSSVEVTQARDIVASVIETFQGRSKDEADEVLRALLERSGILRMRTDVHLDFLHNALKEYLAAVKAVEEGQSDLLIRHARDPAWQPVLLYALALAPENFSSKVVGALLQPSPKERLVMIQRQRQGRSLGAAHKRELRAIRAEQFFLLRCRSAAKCLALPLAAEIDAMGADLFPPASMPEAEALAQIGARLFALSGAPLLNPDWWASLTDSRTAVRGLRMLRLIGGERAKQAIAQMRTFHELCRSTALESEWMDCVAEFALPRVPRWPFGDVIWNYSWRVKDITALEGATETRRLHLRSPIRSLLPLKAMTKLEYVSLSCGDALESLEGLPVSQLQSIRLSGCEAIRDFTYLGNAQAAKSLSLEFCPNLTRIGFIRNLREIEKLRVDQCGLDGPELERLFSMDLQSLKVLELCVLDDMARASVRHLANAAFPKLEELEISDCPKITDSTLKPLRSRTLCGLRKLKLHGCASLESVDFLYEGSWENLIELDLGQCKALTQINGVAAGGLHNLAVLKLNRCDQIRNLAVLCDGGLPGLHQVQVQGCDPGAVARLLEEAKARFPRLEIWG